MKQSQPCTVWASSWLPSILKSASLSERTSQLLGFSYTAQMSEHHEKSCSSTATNHRSHLALIPLEKLFSGRDDILVYTPKSSSDYAQSDDPFENALDNPVVISSKQRHPGPNEPHWKIPPSEWPTILRRVEQNKEPLRQVALDYEVSYETIRRIVRATRILARKREA
jgi:hypothetical protein